jgi:hypothetical protein
MRHVLAALALAAALALIRCSAPPPPPPPPDPLPAIPETIRACPLGGRIPPPLPPVRSVEALGSYLVAMQHLALENERARAVCARAFQELRDWPGWAVIRKAPQ